MSQGEGTMGIWYDAARLGTATSGEKFERGIRHPAADLSLLHHLIVRFLAIPLSDMHG